MARHNDVQLFGIITSSPKICEDSNTGKPIRAAFHVGVIKNYNRDNGTNDKNDIKYDYLLVIVDEPHLIRKVQKYKTNDFIWINGAFTTGKLEKVVACPHCGQLNRHITNICFIYPVFFDKININEDLTQNQALAKLKEYNQVSNHAILLGKVCSDINFHADKGFYTTNYQLAVNRKLFVKTDDPDVTTDFPYIRSYGEVAKNDDDRLKTGATILIDGYLHSRTYDKQIICQNETCGRKFEFKNDVVEVIPYSVEYLNGYYTSIEEKEYEKRKKILSK